MLGRMGCGWWSLWKWLMLAVSRLQRMADSAVFEALKQMGGGVAWCGVGRAWGAWPLALWCCVHVFCEHGEEGSLHKWDCGVWVAALHIAQMGIAHWTKGIVACGWRRCSRGTGRSLKRWSIRGRRVGGRERGAWRAL